MAMEFIRASNVPAERIYVYDGFKLDPQYRGWDSSSIRTRPEYGTVSNPNLGGHPKAAIEGHLKTGQRS